MIVEQKYPFPSSAKAGDVRKAVHDPQIHPIIVLDTYQSFLLAQEKEITFSLGGDSDSGLLFTLSEKSKFFYRNIIQF